MFPVLTPPPFFYFILSLPLFFFPLSELPICISLNSLIALSSAFLAFVFLVLAVLYHIMTCSNSCPVLSIPCFVFPGSSLTLFFGGVSNVSLVVKRSYNNK